VGDPNWFYSTLAQSSAAIVGLAGGFMVSRILAQRSEIAGDRNSARQGMLDLQRDVAAMRQQAERVEKSLRRILPIVENTGQADVSLIETFTHPGNHGQQGNHGAGTDTLALLGQIADDAHDYEKSLTSLAKDQKALADKLYAGQDPEEYATAEWLNEDKEGTLSGGNIYDTLNQQRDWIRNDWYTYCRRFDNLKVAIDNLRVRAALPSLVGLVSVLAAFLALGVFAPLASSSLCSRCPS
jgi:hypothetical protein